MDRAEKIGLGSALGGHALLLAAFFLGLFGANKIIEGPKALEVSLVTETAAKGATEEMEEADSAPLDGREEASAAADVQTDSEPEMMEMAESEVEPGVLEKPVVKPVEKPLPKTLPAKPVQSTAKVPVKTPQKKVLPAPRKSNTTPTRTAPTKTKTKPGGKTVTCDFDCQMRKITGGGTPNKSKNPGGKNPGGKSPDGGKAPGGSKKPGGKPDSPGGPGTKTTAQVRNAIQFSIKGEAQPKWNGCRIVRGPDITQLRTVIKFRLKTNGALDAITSINTTGQTPSNKTQVARFEECAEFAVRAAAPFGNLPAEHYSAWQNYKLTFDKAN